ncbi:MAG: SDR family oxidoreductase [Myxococcales bacterium]|nr:SDR family oxidoreductase [Myxococcales bacterium]MDH5306888.1 SDR family oxidoreductase [Myxococcales bacterium]MDH5565775.1 SDR family oxidoreductase [Myxococcales bacterium]
MAFSSDLWAVILGGSSGFGLATAQRLAEQGMSVCVVHRDRRAALARIEPEFEKIRSTGAKLLTFNTDALVAEKRSEVLDELAQTLGSEGRVRVLLHSVAFGNLKLLVPERKPERKAAREIAARLGVDAEKFQQAVDEVFEAGHPNAHALASPPDYSEKHFLDEDDFLRTIHAMGTSLLGWVQGLFERRLFADDARVFGLTSEGNEVAWKGYAAVAAAKVSLESLARSIATEFAPYGVRCNVIQAGITETPALAAIPGSDHMKAQARLRNPLGRLTTPRDVANVIALLATDEAAWINGDVIRVDGGEHISGISQ